MAEDLHTGLESQEPGVGLWMLTFSDCMTLLLTFFVMMVSFSSFDDYRLRRLSGALAGPFAAGVLGAGRATHDSLVPKPDLAVDWTVKGSERPHTFRPQNVRNPREYAPILKTDAYRDEKTFYIPAGKMFLGGGCVLTQQGLSILENIAALMDEVPCIMVVGEVPPAGAQSPEAGGTDNGLTRAWTVVRFLADRGLPDDRFKIAGAGSFQSRQLPDKPAMLIALLAKDPTL